jgi:hypothetical protein
MPLSIASSEDLHISVSHFNEHGLAVLMLAGGRYGGDWTVRANSRDNTVGEFRTAVDDRRKQALLKDSGYPDRAIESAFIWLMEQAKRQDLRVVSFENLNGKYAEAERPFFCLAQAVVANEIFKPAPGVTYADEMTLDAVMGYVAD